MEFVDRRDAGRKLAAQLLPLAAEHPVVIALPRGGVPIASEVARALRAPLDILAVRKLGAPGNPEFGVGAITEDGSAVLNTEIAYRVGMTQELLEATVEREVRELRRRVERYRDGRPRIDVRGRCWRPVSERPGRSEGELHACGPYLVMALTGKPSAISPAGAREATPERVRCRTPIA